MSNMAFFSARFPRFFKYMLCGALTALALPFQARAVVRDAEIEMTLEEIFRPVAEAAGGNYGGVKPVLINDPQFNAFVRDGKSVYLHTGLIMKAKNAGQLRGVMAHELGHITGGHIARTGEAARDVLVQSLLTTAAVGAAALAAGGGGGGVAGGLLAGQQVGFGAFTAYSRAQESAADQAALNFLQKSGQSPRGVLEVLQYLSEREKTATAYMRTHPLSRQRLAAVQKRAKASPYFSAPESPALEKKYARAVAKIVGFLEDPTVALSLYPPNDISTAALIARAAAYRKTGESRKMRKTLAALKKAEPKDPYIYDLTGQLLFESGDIKGAIADYEKAYRLSNENPLIGIFYARAVSATDDPEKNKFAAKLIKKALLSERNYPLAHRSLSVAYDRSGEPGKAALASAQYYMLIGDRSRAKRQAERALRTLPDNTPEKFQAKDIIFFSKKTVE